MTVDLKNIFKSEDYFWYPEITKKLNEIKNDSTLASVDIDIAKIYNQRKKNCINHLKIFFQKIFNHIKQVFSLKYREQLDRGFKILKRSIDIKLQLKDAPVDGLKKDSFLTPQKGARTSAIFNKS